MHVRRWKEVDRERKAGAKPVRRAAKTEYTARTLRLCKPVGQGRVLKCKKQSPYWLIFAFTDILKALTSILL